MSQQSLSIIVPVFNAVDTIINALTSIETAVRQLSTQHTVVASLILVDDGSTDHTVSQVTEWMESRRNSNLLQCRIIRQEQQGPSIARNTGALESTDDWLLFVDSDVLINDHALLRMFEDLPEPSSVFGINAMPTPWVPNGNWVTQYVNGSLRYQILQHGQHVNTCFTSCCLLSRGAWNALGQWDPSRSSRYSDDIQSRWSLPPKCIVQNDEIQFVHLKYVRLSGLLKHRFNLGYHYRSSLTSKASSAHAVPSVLHYRYPLNVILAGLSPFILGIVGSTVSWSVAVSILILTLTGINWQFLVNFRSQSNPSFFRVIMDQTLGNGLSFLEGWAMGLGIFLSLPSLSPVKSEPEHERS